MLVYGERTRRLAPRAVLRGLTATLREVEAEAPGPDRHDLLTAAFLQAAGLAQGAADAEFEALGFDEASAAQDAVMALVVTLARKLTASAWSGYAQAGPPASSELMAAALAPLPEEVDVRTPEGFAVGALYPETFLKAAAEHPWPAPPLVIGLRSAGVGLAALVAVASGASTVMTLRPAGEPFARRLMVSPALKAVIAAHEGPVAVVGEGPGVSSGDFTAAVELVQAQGIEPGRIVLIASGAQGPALERWPGLKAAPALFEDFLGEQPVAGWFEDLTGPVERVESLSAGAWRALLWPDARDWPPVFAAQERRKYRLTAASGTWIARFAGLGEIGAAKFARALLLHEAGFTPRPLGLRRGFILERWEDGTPGLRIERDELIAWLGRYLAFRDASFGAQPGDGASLDDLAEMVRVNAAELLGEAEAQSLGRRLAACRSEAGRPRPVHVDGRLHRWEWLQRPDGTLVKCDALDHSTAHDMVGCQDIAWDVAGASVEFDLTAAEVDQLCEAVGRAGGRRPDPGLVLFCEIAYPAFQAALWSAALHAAPEEERLRLEAQVARYRGHLARFA
jgi:hypothetical protein